MQGCHLHPSSSSAFSPFSLVNNWYESQKRCEWNEFLLYLSGLQERPLTPEQCTGEHVINFLDFFYFSDPEIGGEIKVRALIFRLREAYEENVEIHGRSRSNPFESERVTRYLSQELRRVHPSAATACRTRSSRSSCHSSHLQISSSLPSFSPVGNNRKKLKAAVAVAASFSKAKRFKVEEVTMHQLQEVRQSHPSPSASTLTYETSQSKQLSSFSPFPPAGESWYESKKRSDWDRFLLYLNSLELNPEQCGGEQAVEFLKHYLSDSKIGRETKVSALISRLREAYREKININVNSNSNPFEAPEIKLYLSQEAREIYPSATSSCRTRNTLDWNAFIHYLRNQNPMLTPDSCTAEHVIGFLKFSDQFGKTRFHIPGCPLYGSVSKACSCPLQHDWQSLQGLAFSLHSAYNKNIGTPLSSPFMAKEVRVYIRQVMKLQSMSLRVKKSKKRKNKNKKRKRHPLPATAVAGSSTAAQASIEQEEICEKSRWEVVDFNFMSSSPEHEAGSSTTRFEHLFLEASFDRCRDAPLHVSEVYDLGGLAEYEFWNLFQGNAFGARDFAGYEKLEHIGKEIVERCNGVPLATKMIGSLLRCCEKDANIWMDVLHNMQEGSDVTGQDALMRAVKVSYTFMPSHLKTCIAYCSAFRRDYIFTKDEIVKLWVEEDLIQSSGSKTLEDIGAEYFDDLQRRLYFHRAPGFEDEAFDTFSMLDLVHDLSEKIEIAMDLPHTISDETIVYGRENDKRKVIELLLSDECRKRDVSVIHIVGPSGVGKTTLVNLVYNDPTVCKIFETRLWISLNENSDLKGLTKALVESLTGIFCGLTDLTEIQEALREELMGTRFLLVLDNVYNDHDLSFWNSLLGSLSTSGKGSIVITTTRDRIPTGDMDMMHSYKLNRLSEIICWFVFRQHAFNLRDYNVHPDLVKIGKQLANRVEGLPLAAKTLGGSLCSEQNKIIWQEILDSELWYTNLPASGSTSSLLRMHQDDQLGVDKILPALRLSYDHLTFNVQRCFHYCSLFPKGYIFDKDHLVRLWMSSQVMNVKHNPLKKGEVFIKHKEGKLEQDIGNQYFDELLKRSFFQHSPICDPAVENYVMHDQFHDLAQSESGSEFFRAETSKLSIVPEGVRHISLVPSEFGTALQFEGFKHPTYIHTLLLINRSNIKWAPSVLCVENPAILNDLFSTLTHLRILDLSFTNIEEVPGSIANLKQLRYLALNRSNIRKLPESVCSLYELRTLELQGCSYLSELPASIGNLSNLQHLLVWKESGFVFMPSGIGKLSNLGTLSTFTVGRDKWQCGIKELKDLMNLRGTLCIGGLGNVVRGKEAMEAKLEKKQYLRTLTLQWLNGCEDLANDIIVDAAFEVLRNLKPHSNIEELTLCDYSGDQFPKWMVDPSFSKLTSITLDNCYECNIIPPLGQLPSLKHLSIRMMDGVQRVGRQFCGSGTSRGFPSLETLKFWEMYELEEWCGVEGEDFPCLRSLSISRCDKLRKLPCFSYLQELSIHYCAKLLDLPTLPCLKSLKIDGLQNLESLLQPLDLPALKILEVNNCNHLMSLVGLCQIASLEKLKITRCPKLGFSPNEQLPSMLQVVDICGGCSLLSNWCPDGFEEIINVHQVRRKLARQAAS